MRLPKLSSAGLVPRPESARSLSARLGQRRRDRRFTLEPLETRQLLATIAEFSAALLKGGITSQGGSFWLTRSSDVAMINPSNPGSMQTYSQGLPADPRLGAITTGPAPHNNLLWFTETNSHAIGMLDASNPSQPIVNYSNANAPGLPVDADPESITVGPDGHGNQVIWFIDRKHNALGWLDPSTPTNITEIPIPATMVGVTSIQPQIVAGPGGWLFFTEANFDTHSGGLTASAIGAYNPANPASTQWLESPLTGTPAQQPFGITLGPDKNSVWFTAAAPIGGTFDYQSYAVGMASVTGNSLSITEIPLTSPSGDTTLFPNQIAAGPDDNVWFDWVTNDPAGSGGYIESINPTNHVVAAPIAIPTSVVSKPLPAGITAGPDGNVWFVDPGGALGRVTLDTSLQITSQPPASVPAGSKFGLTVRVTYSTGAPFSGNVTVSLQDNPGGSTLGGTTTVTAVNSLANFADLTLNNADSGYTLKVTALGESLSTGTINVTSTTTTTATQLVVFAPPPGTVVAGSPFGLTVYAETASGAVDPTFNGPVTITLVGGTLSGNTTVMAANGKATFAGLILNNVGSGFTLQATSNGLASVTTQPITVTPSQPPPTPPSVIGKAIFTQKRNKKGKPVGKPVFGGFEFDFSTAMNSSEGSSANYAMGAFVTQGRGRKSKTVLQPTGFSVSVLGASSVLLKPSGRQTFAKGGQITLNAGGLVSSAGASLVGRTAFNISRGGKSLS